MAAKKRTKKKATGEGKTHEWKCRGPVKSGCGGRGAKVVPMNARERSAISEAKRKQKAGERLERQAKRLKTNAAEIERDTKKAAEARVEAEKAAKQAKKEADAAAKKAKAASRAAKKAG